MEAPIRKLLAFWPQSWAVYHLFIDEVEDFSSMVMPSHTGRRGRHGRFSPNFSTIHSLFRRQHTQVLDGVDVAVVGVPFDLATTGRSGARLGPQAVRQASGHLSGLIPTGFFPFGLNPFETLKVIDYGDIKFHTAYPLECPDVITEHIRHLLASDVSTVAIGGDHFIAYPILRAYAEKYGPISLVHFDAHRDTWDDDGTMLDHGTMLSRAAKEGIVAPERSVQVGIRTYSDKDWGFHVLDAPFVHKTPSEVVCQRIQDIVGDHPAYLTFDVDCLDPAYAPGTGTPVPGGLSTAQACALLSGLTSLSWVGMDIVEVAPAYDHAEITALAAAQLIAYYLCLRALQKQAGR